MFRTRDFLLFASIAGFLLVAISGTLVMRWNDEQTGGQATFAVPDAPSLELDEIEYTASLSATDTDSRAQRLAAMKQKIAARGELIRSPEPEPLPEPVMPTSSATSSSVDGTGSVAVRRCPAYAPYTKAWSAASIEITEGEGARLVTDTSSETLLMTLPLRTQSQGGTNCLQTDVVGIAKDGSLIRNAEIGLYSVFGAETVVGYALDGFPIYGVSTQATDSCGGAATSGQYGYYLNPERSAVLGCFAAPPQLLP